jgi:hypothetical protein
MLAIRKALVVSDAQVSGAEGTNNDLFKDVLENLERDKR